MLNKWSFEIHDFMPSETLRLRDNYHFVEIATNPPDLLLKLKRAVYVSLPISRNFVDVSNAYKIVKKCNIDLIINPITSLAPIYVGIPYIVTIHDLQYKYYPSFFTLKQRILRDYVYKHAAKNASLVICESNFVKLDLMRILKIPERKLRVIPSPPPENHVAYEINGGKLEKIKNKYKIPNEFLFYPAHFWYHKNHAKLFQSLAFLKRKYKEEIPVILVGLKKNGFGQAMQTIKELKMAKQIKWLDYVPEEDIACLYKLSTALVMPTLFESLSMPIWEALCLGVPVASSKVCALPEQVGNAGLLFDPYNVLDMAEKIYKIWTDDELKQRLIKNGYERVKNLTLENYARNWEEVIDTAIQKSRR